MLLSAVPVIATFHPSIPNLLTICQAYCNDDVSGEGAKGPPGCFYNYRESPVTDQGLPYFHRKPASKTSQEISQLAGAPPRVRLCEPRPASRLAPCKASQPGIRPCQKVRSHQFQPTASFLRKYQSHPLGRAWPLLSFCQFAPY